MKKLGIAKARDLLKRELGISAAKLEMPPMMNQNPRYPWYELQAGNLQIALGSTVELDNKLIRLSMSFNDGRGSLTRYYYADTLAEAPEFVERDRWEEAIENAENCEYSREAMQRHSIHLSNAAGKAYRKHVETVRLRTAAAEQYAQADTAQEADELER